MDDKPITVAGTSVAVDGFCVLIRGPSGIGKSDLALRCLHARPIAQSASEFELVSDDQTLLRRSGERLYASAPSAIAGQLEVRGIGIISLRAVEEAELVLVAELTRKTIVRMPDYPGETVAFGGVNVDCIALNAAEPSAPAKLSLALARSVAHLSTQRATC